MAAIKQLKSFVGGKWVSGSGTPRPLYNPTTEEVIAETSTDGIDFAAALEYARSGGAALRAMTFEERGEMLGALAKAWHAHRDALLQLSTDSGGNTSSDAKFDVDGATGTLAFYASIGKKLGARTFLADGEMVQLTRAPRYVGQHVLVPRLGAAVHINAFNFPAWGMGEKLAVSFLAGMPTIVKPATSTAPLAAAMVEIAVDSGLLPAGALSFIAGPCGDLVDHMGFQDVLAFTGSADTGAFLRSKENIIKNSVRVNVEADSLNSAVLGPDVERESETYDMFLRELVKDMTQKAGQKCTAIRRVFVPSGLLDVVQEDLCEQLSSMKTGNPNSKGVRIGPLSTASQLADGLAGIEKLKTCAEVVFGGSRGDLVDVPDEKGYFLSPTVLCARDPANADAVHSLEVFGPVVTLMPYGEDVDELCSWIGRAQGGLVSSVYSDKKGFVKKMIMGIAPYHGRLTIGNERVAEHSPGPGSVLPSLVHGGPGRAGCGQELGGQRGLSLYMQRTAVQCSKPLLEKLLLG